MIRELQRRHLGPVLDARDPGYNTGRISFNALLDRHPSVIARAARVEDVSEGMAFARRVGLPVAVRGGGHSVAGHSMCDEGLVIDLRLMTGVVIDTERRRVVAGGGATWRDVDAPCVTRGLVMPGGTFDTTGVAGLTLGGGLGHLMGVQGLTLDHLVGADVVLANGEAVRAAADSHPDLFWALRGGGGNFGVVTAFEFSLEPLPSVSGGVIEYDSPHLSDVLRMYREIMTSAPDEMTMMTYVSRGVVHVTVCAVEGESVHTGAIKRLR